LRSAHYLSAELGLRQEIGQLRQSIPEPSAWDRLAAERNNRRIASLRIELDGISDDLEWTFSGTGVYDHKMSLGRLSQLSDPLGRALRWTARDIVFMEWGESPAGSIREVIEPLVVGTVNGSFGLRLTRPQDEQGSLIGGSLFDSTVERVLSAFQSAADGDSPEELFDKIPGLRNRAIKGIRDLSILIAQSGQPSQIRWRRDRLLTVTKANAERLAEILESAQTDEGTVTVRARIRGADLDSYAFHLMESTPEGDKHYQGKADPSLIHRLEGVGLDAEVVATLRVVTLESRTLREPRESYALMSFDLVDPDALLA